MMPNQHKENCRSLPPTSWTKRSCSRTGSPSWQWASLTAAVGRRDFVSCSHPLSVPEPDRHDTFVACPPHPSYSHDSLHKCNQNTGSPLYLKSRSGIGYVLTTVAASPGHNEDEGADDRSSMNGENGQRSWCDTEAVIMEVKNVVPSAKVLNIAAGEVSMRLPLKVQRACFFAWSNVRFCYYVLHSFNCYAGRSSLVLCKS